MNHAEQRQAAKKFAEKWKGRGYEKGESASFWLSLLSEVFGVENPDELILFEERVMLDHTSFIDGYIPSTHVLIEQKSIDKDLGKAIRQSDGSLLTPFQQAKRYSAELPYSERPRWVVISNFKEFRIYDMEKPTGEPEVLHLNNLEDEYYRLSFLLHKDDDNIRKAKEVSIKAGELVGVLYDALLKEYENPEDEEVLHSLNTLCVRLVFCFYAEDSGLFGRHSMFHDYLIKHKGIHFRGALIKLFEVLDEKPDERDPYLEDDLAAFPYVNRGLFKKINIIIPRINEEIIDIILNRASANFDWSKISPTIFGGVFESTLNPETRRSGGMHYTSIENIHKVIDPLFMNDLNQEFQEIKENKYEKTRNIKLEAFQKKLSSLKFLDPAAGSGNFLTETYLSLRRLENKVIALRYSDQVVMGEAFDPIQVSIGQFYGIEINDFAVTVGKTALWIAESQMIQETENIIHMNIDFLPLKSYAIIVEGNALRMDWEDVIKSNELNYIMGNPPFLGHSVQNSKQKKEMRDIYIDEDGKEHRLAGKIDYVAGWYFKSAELINNTNIRVAFVSTNSVTQGEQVVGVWKPIYEQFNIQIDYAYKTFKWNNESTTKAQVHVVIIGFSHNSNNFTPKKIFSNSNIFEIAKNINPYLIDAPTVLVESTRKPLCNVPPMIYGNKPTDGGFFFLTLDEKDRLISKEPQAEKYIRRVYGSTEFINDEERYCLWLKDATPQELKNMPLVIERVQKVKEYRLESKAKSTQKYADYPTRFKQDSQPDTDFLLVPCVSSENRRYVPIGFMSYENIVTNAVQFVPNATLYEFGIITSNVHMAWMRTVTGRLKSDYRYSSTLVYNTFPWADPDNKQKSKIEKTAQSILDARSLYPESSLSDLYDELTMPVELRKSHQENDKAVMEAYGFDWRNMTESKTVAELMKLYKQLVKFNI